ncbi:Chemotaxis signal transduction protein [Cupriavidus necator H850]|nr:Chemotaxis signal transduction protein [Cupriavidus necator H850]
MAEPQGIALRTENVDDCWRRIGVRGDGSCPALAEHAHCRNCPTYAQAAAMLLDAQRLDVVPDALPDAATLTDDDGALPAERGIALACLVFRIGDEWLALPTAALGEVTAPLPDPFAAAPPRCRRAGAGRRARQPAGLPVAGAAVRRGRR